MSITAVDLIRIEKKLDELLAMSSMVKEIHAHLGLDCHKVVSMKSIQDQARRDVLKWQERQIRRGHECKAT